ncbi:hypothetical protein A3J19_03425 [Candidatus Daviesbacteria bacterium RIFCSPLOWO2_02_FULL_41_8]|uniref:Cytidyltransferase-like domain-containing protein n=2 Tax=Candidatus Daviesiibacteriota TaxID=1752718 RepID=A0A1F5NLP7_9BACT|nr:MAG: hypothetical protein A2871_04420 [Candidatus Daviesbacteria bacterium RIFCSPHIGHO2_01_FULL_41_23]OGE62224.1 MAG: hypothetical protein A2967_02055 [Candidatus Daviesbacteria bacterium RIFCSPLOWO2_01_FULL_41_32]OGE78599.1 MAG: hypothetical protein A3J19_03425 [Candidatus Daviesbacteria bacterium RIFCSPLOWO2_02_FULL_41_8]
MEKIISLGKLSSHIATFKNQGKKTVLVGGCFDILHPGHVIFLKKAKKIADILIVFLESDKKVCELKGANRPVHSQRMRATVLSALAAVDYIILLPYLRSEADYDKAVQKIKPAIIAMTAGYERIEHHKRAAKLTGAKLQYVTKRIKDYSTGKILGH